MIKRKKKKGRNSMANDLADNRKSIYDDEISFESDVFKDEKAVIDGEFDGCPVIVKQIRKQFRGGCCNKKPFTAVRSLSFHVTKSSCFGLLGVNGAGKTTTFSMLTGDILPTRGTAVVGGYNVVTQLNDSRKHLGYCPQFDAIDMLLTVRENLFLYARLRGIPKSVRERVITELIMKMELSIYAESVVGTLSGGNKRKLSTAIALLGDPMIIFLDEPTAGMDPKARRFLWKCVLDSVKEGRSVVLTSHSMEECEALCTSVGIMVNGQFKCMGTTQHLKNKYGEGYMVEARTRPGMSDRAEDYFKSKYPNAIVKEKLPTLVVFQIPREVKVAEIFAHMESSKRKKSRSKIIEDYSISQTSLDQLFISFASQQGDEKADDDSHRSTIVPEESNVYQDLPDIASLVEYFRKNAAPRIITNNRF